LCCLLAVFISANLISANASQPQLKTASTHPIQYYLSLPDGWSAGKKWPVVVVIESANREFQNAATIFAQSRQSVPFILITPLVVTNGGAGYRSVPTYHYSNAVWDQIQNSGPFNFDMDGITAIMKDVVKEYGGEDRYFVTGFEAGGHSVWAIVLNHPEFTRGAALVIPNYLGRWVDEEHISSDAKRVDLPIRVFVGSKDNAAAGGSPIFTQLERAIQVANAHGYRNVSRVSVAGKGHEPLADEVLAKVRDFITLAHGMLLVTGPTGSGKTTTLYGALAQMNSPECKIITVEDPVEYRLPGITQVQVNEKIGLAFSTVLRSTLRQDPDIVLVGEMRDKDTVETGLRAAMTGHMVLSTLHTNDAASTPMRLLDMGAPRYLVATSLRLVLAQRLLRAVCTHCSRPYAATAQEQAFLQAFGGGGSGKGLAKGAGCQHCNGTGFLGRLGAYELLEMTPRVVAAFNGGDTQTYLDAARRVGLIETLNPT